MFDRIKENCHALTRTLIQTMRLTPSLRRLVLLASALLVALAPAAHAVAVSAPPSPNITTQPANLAVAPGKNATFSVKATGTGKLTYQWQLSTDNGDTFNNLSNQVPFSGVTTATLTVKAASIVGNNGNEFQCIVTDGNKHSETSSTATLSVVTPVTILAQPQAVLTTLQGSAMFQVTINDTPDVSLQWFKNTTAIPQATTTALKLANVQASDVATYYVVVTNPTATVTSAKVKLTLGTVPVVSNPSDTGVVAGKSATFKVTATGTATLTYVWKVYSGGEGFFPLSNNSTIAGATTATLTVKSATQGMDGYQYECIVTNTLGSDTSDPATLSVGAVPAVSTPTVSGSPVVAGNSPTLMATITAGSGTLNYQWFKKGAPIDGKSGSGTVSGNSLPVTISLQLPDVQLGDAGSYTLMVSNGVGNVTSKALTFTVTPPATGGIFFGTYSGTDGEKGKIGVIVDDNGNAVVLHVASSPTGTDGGNNTGGVIPTFSVDATGAFSADVGSNSTFNGTATGASFNGIYFNAADQNDAANTVTLTATPKLATGIQAANAGLYSGTFSGVNGQGDSNTGAVTALLAADGSLLVVVTPDNGNNDDNNDGGNDGGDNADVKNVDADNNDNSSQQGGSGTVSASNAVSFTIFDGGGSGTGKIHTNTDIPTITGNYTGSGHSSGNFTLTLTPVDNFTAPSSGN
jgi:hypothetical protein